MKGFFTKHETKSDNISNNTKKLSCYSCKLYKGDIDSPKIKAFGKFRKEILNIGDFSTNADDQHNKAFQGKDGRYVEHAYTKLGISLQDDCLNINAVMCLPLNKKGGQRNPTNHEINCCRINIMQLIKKHKPKLIVLFGDVALQSVIGNRWKKDLGNITKWRGWTIPDQELKAWICPTFNPSYIAALDKKGNASGETVWEQDLRRAVNLLKDEFPISKKPTIRYITDLDILNNIPKGTLTAFDYETTGLKPHGKGHELICASIATSEDRVYTFMIPKNEKKRKPFLKYLKNKKIPKIAQNSKFETAWSDVKLGITVKNWIWDTMLATHIMDNRRNITSLKFQTYVQFGIIDYDSEINPYLLAKDSDGANGLNTIKTLLNKPKMAKKLLKYCAYDSIYEYRLAIYQRKVMENILPF